MTHLEDLPTQVKETGHQAYTANRNYMAGKLKQKVIELKSLSVKKTQLQQKLDILHTISLAPEQEKPAARTTQAPKLIAPSPIIACHHRFKSESRRPNAWGQRFDHGEEQQQGV